MTYGGYIPVLGDVISGIQITAQIIQAVHNGGASKANLEAIGLAALSSIPYVGDVIGGIVVTDEVVQASKNGGGYNLEGMVTFGGQSFDLNTGKAIAPKWTPCGNKPTPATGGDQQCQNVVYNEKLSNYNYSIPFDPNTGTGPLPYLFGPPGNLNLYDPRDGHCKATRFDAKTGETPDDPNRALFYGFIAAPCDATDGTSDPAPWVHNDAPPPADTPGYDPTAHLTPTNHRIGKLPNIPIINIPTAPPMGSLPAPATPSVTIPGDPPPPVAFIPGSVPTPAPAPPPAPDPYEGCYWVPDNPDPVIPDAPGPGCYWVNN